MHFSRRVKKWAISESLGGEFQTFGMGMGGERGPGYLLEKGGREEKDKDTKF